MKGIILAGGTGSRLYPLTKVTNKHLLPVYDRAMICYPIQTMVNAGITDIMIVCGKEHSGQFIELLGDGHEYGCNIVYGVQEGAGGISEALLVAESFIGSDSMCVILGDNIFQEDISKWVTLFNNSTKVNMGLTHSLTSIELCHILCKKVDEPQHYGVLFDTGIRITVVEKPIKSMSNLAVTGLYFYTSDVFNKIKNLEPSNRNELEVTDLNNMYAKGGNLIYSITNQKWWDVGISIDHMLKVSNEIKEMGDV